MTLLNLIERADHHVVASLQKVRQPAVIAGFKAASHTGDGYLHVLCIAWAWWWPTDAALHFLEAALIAFSVERCLYWFVKNRLRRRRPSAAMPSFEALIKPSDQFSFPSGHTMAAFLLATLVHLSFDASAVGVYLWAIMVGCSRVVLGVHFPSDVVVGAVIGVLIALIGVGLA